MENLSRLKKEIEKYKHLRFTLEKEEDSKLYYKCIDEEFSFNVSEENDGVLVFTLELVDKRNDKPIQMVTHIDQSMLFSGIMFENSESFVSGICENYFRELQVLYSSVL